MLQYYYDTETGFYYLQTRYYDPEVGRFLNMDSIDYADPESLDGLNLYAYCNNNPVMYYDPTGTSILAALFLALGLLLSGTIVGGAVAGVKSYKNGNRGWDLIGDIVLGASIGLAISGATLALTGVIVGAIGGASATIWGLSAKTLFAIGALAFDFTAFVIAPIFGFTMQAIEYKKQKPLPLFQSPQPTPPHPYK